LAEEKNWVCVQSSRIRTFIFGDAGKERQGCLDAKVAERPAWARIAVAHLERVT